MSFNIFRKSILSVTLASLGTATACSSTLFTGTTPPVPRKPAAIAPPEKDGHLTPAPTPVPSPAPTPIITIVPTPVATPIIVPTVPLNLSVERLKSASWWKNCLTVTLNDQVKQIGCNKDQNVLGKVVTFEAFKFPACNTLKVSILTFKNQGEICSNRLKQGLGCEGPYSETPSWIRNTNQPTDKQFFKVYDATNIAKADKLIDSGYNFADLQKNFLAFVSGKPHTWLRVFFEDQSDTNLAAWEADTGNWQKYGVDFNDFVFDLKSEGVKFKVEGSTIDSCK